MSRKVENQKYGAVIGLEIHAELKTASKMFCSCANDPFNAQPNEHVCPICMGFPGTLPVPNKRAIELTLAVGKALQCMPAKVSKFDRKNYFYPDLPKGYQISQYDLPFVEGGKMTVEGTTVRIRRVHLEEDTGKNIHKVGDRASLVDYNRAGVPLIELVTEPDITSAKLASAFAKELQQILRYVGASNADMEKGEMRVEANVSIQKQGSKEFGTKVEVKNLNSFRAVEHAIEYEVERHTDLLEKGQKIEQETRGWDEDKGVTFSQRTKEGAEDYRYFPEPDIPPIVITKIVEQQITGKARIVLPDQLRRDLVEVGVSEKEAAIMVADPIFKEYYDAISHRPGLDKKVVAKVLVNLGWSTTWDQVAVANTIKRYQDGKITDVMLKEAFKKARRTGQFTEPEAVQVISDHEQLATIIDEVIRKNSVAVADVQAGKAQAMGFLVGQVMAKTKGRADPKMVSNLLQRKLQQ